MDPADLDDLLNRELKGLPPPRAPRTLLPRVMEAAAGLPQREWADGASVQPAVPTGWSTWSAGQQAMAVAALCVLVAAITMFLNAPPSGAVEAARTASETATVVRVLWDVMLQPVATYMFVLGISLALACAGAWAAMEFALGGASHR